MAINKKSNKKFFAKIGVYREKLESYNSQIPFG